MANCATGLVNTLTNARRMAEAQAVLDSGVLEAEMDKYHGEYARPLQDDKDLGGTGYKRKKSKTKTKTTKKEEGRGKKEDEESEVDDDIQVRSWTREEEPGMRPINVEI